MIQINLLPDVKMQYIKAQRIRAIAISTSFIFASLSILAVVVLYSFGLTQNHKIGNLDAQVQSETNELKNKPNVSKVLTVQSQLNSLTTLHEQEPATDRLFSTYLTELTPSTVSISNLTTDFTANTATITGSAASISAIDQYVDIFKLTTFTSNNATQGNAFSNVLLSNFGVNPSPMGTNDEASYTITLSFSPTLFNNTDNIALHVPSEISTRSVLDAPTLFQSNSTNGQGK